VTGAGGGGGGGEYTVDCTVQAVIAAAIATVNPDRNIFDEYITSPHRCR
jgi:hypothetical protein